jgi:hypothetical protein
VGSFLKPGATSVWRILYPLHEFVIHILTKAHIWFCLPCSRYTLFFLTASKHNVYQQHLNTTIHHVYQHCLNTATLCMCNCYQQHLNTMSINSTWTQLCAMARGEVSRSCNIQCIVMLSCSCRVHCIVVYSYSCNIQCIVMFSCSCHVQCIVVYSYSCNIQCIVMLSCSCHVQCIVCSYTQPYTVHDNCS